MMNITTDFTEIELTDLGRAMERAGFTDFAEFARWAISEKKEEVLSK